MFAIICVHCVLKILAYQILVLCPSSSYQLPWMTLHCLFFFFLAKWLYIVIIWKVLQSNKITSSLVFLFKDKMTRNYNPIFFKKNRIIFCASSNRRLGISKTMVPLFFFFLFLASPSTFCVPNWILTWELSIIQCHSTIKKKISVSYT